MRYFKYERDKQAEINAGEFKRAKAFMEKNLKER